MTFKYEIIQEDCTGCQQCIKSCPSGSAIRTNEGGLYIDENFCIECGHCAAVCSKGAILCNGEALPSVKKIEISPKDLYSLIEQKRSVRNYQDKEISNGNLDEILSLAAFSPVASNNRGIQMSILKGDEVINCSKIIAEFMLKQLKMFANPLFKFFQGSKIPHGYKNPKKLNEFMEIMEKTVSGEIDRMFFKAPIVVVLSYPEAKYEWGRTDCAIAGTQAMLYAESLGINSCIIGFAERYSNKEQVRIALKIPKGYASGFVFTLGYGNEKYFKVPKREKF